MKRLLTASLLLFYLNGCSLQHLFPLQEAGTVKHLKTMQKQEKPESLFPDFDLSWQNIASGVAVAVIAVMTFM